MALVKATIKQIFVDMYADAKDSELTDAEFADLMAQAMIDIITTADVSGTATGAQGGGGGVPIVGTLS